RRHLRTACPRQCVESRSRACFVVGGLMSDSNPFRNFLDTREAQLIEEIGRLRSQLVPMEKELAEIRAAKGALGLSTGTSTLASVLVQGLPQANSNHSALASIIATHGMAAATSPSIKQLALQALRDHFPAGATSQQIREFIRDGYGRDVERS